MITNPKATDKKCVRTQLLVIGDYNVHQWLSRSLKQVRRAQSMCTSPNWTAFLMAAIREPTLSFASRFATCVFTVPSAMKS